MLRFYYSDLRPIADVRWHTQSCAKHLTQLEVLRSTLEMAHVLHHVHSCKPLRQQPYARALTWLQHNFQHFGACEILLLLLSKQFLGLPFLGDNSRVRTQSLPESLKRNTSINKQVAAQTTIGYWAIENPGFRRIIFVQSNSCHGNRVCGFNPVIKELCAV